MTSPSPGEQDGPVVQLVRTLACHARGRRFEPVPGRHMLLWLSWQSTSLVRTRSRVRIALAAPIKPAQECRLWRFLSGIIVFITLSFGAFSDTSGSQKVVKYQVPASNQKKGPGPWNKPGSRGLSLCPGEGTPGQSYSCSAETGSSASILINLTALCRMLRILTPFTGASSPSRVPRSIKACT